MRHITLWMLLLCCGLDCRGRDDKADDKAQEPGAHTRVAPAPPTPVDHVRMIPATPDGDVREAVRRTVAEESGGAVRTVVVYVGASWCEPCQRFHEAAQSGKLDTSFPGLTLLEFDLDRDRERLAAAGYVSKYIPLFALPAADGSASGKQIEGAVKGDGALAFIAPRLRVLLGLDAPTADPR
jgi:hypothetical protein